MRPLYPDDFWEVDIYWSRPNLYRNIRGSGHDLDDWAYLYLLSVKYARYARKPVYIGKTYHQSVSVRLNQDDHKKRYAAIVQNYPRHQLFVSYGCVKLKHGKITEKRISDIEKILVHANDPDHSHNVKNFYYHGVSGSYDIRTRGYRCGLPVRIKLGVFVQ